MRSIWAYCWKCESPTYSKEYTREIKSDYQKFIFCLGCYEEFISNNSSFFRPEKNREREISRSLRRAVYDFHDFMYEKKSPLDDYSKNFTLIHTKESMDDCEICKDIMNYNYKDEGV